MVVGDDDPGQGPGWHQEVLRGRPGRPGRDGGLRGIIYRSGDSYFSLYPTEFAGTAQHTLGAFMVQDVEATVAELRGKGVTFEEYDLPGLKTVNGIAELGGTRGAWFKDPEGNILSVVQLPAA
jgi:catechol 2,3-dioxygenase-like lactoylglutathione lyase family enzyme